MLIEQIADLAISQDKIQEAIDRIKKYSGPEYQTLIDGLAGVHKGISVELEKNYTTKLEGAR